VFRRPVLADEKAALLKVYKDMRVAPLSYDHKGALRVVLQAMLQAPQFLYRWELGPSAPTSDGELLKLNGFEVASRLSYTLWRSMPDDGLLDAAQAGKLATAVGIAEAARRMVGDPKARETVMDFHAQWLSLERLETLPKDPKVYPDWSAGLAAAMQDETSRFVADALLGEGKLDALFTGSTGFVNGALAKLYGISGITGNDFKKVALPKERAGLFTQGSFLAVEALPQESSPVRRGKVITERLLCQHLAPAPPDLNVTPPKPVANQQTREAYEVHTSNQYCRSCHQMMDPLGFAFEAFDGIGRYRTMETGRPVNAASSITLGGQVRRFDGAREFLGILAGSDDVRRCVATQWMQFALAREITEDDRAPFGAAYAAFAKSGFDVRELLVAMLATKSFTHRRPAAEEVIQ
jgi:hypothetical protein